MLWSYFYHSNLEFENYCFKIIKGVCQINRRASFVSLLFIKSKIIQIEGIMSLIQQVLYNNIPDYLHEILEQSK